MTEQLFDSQIIQGIERLGFPIALVLLFLPLIFFIVRWALGTINKQLESEREIRLSQYKEHRADIHDLADKFTKTTDKTVDAFTLSIQESAEKHSHIMAKLQSHDTYLQNISTQTGQILDKVKQKQ